MTNEIKTSQIIIDEIIQRINTKQLTAGSKLPSERVMAETFNISRASVREAFSTLKNLGIVNIKQGGGAYVTDFKVDPLFDAISPFLFNKNHIDDDILEFRKILEVNAAGMACQASSTSKLKDIVEQMLSAMEETSCLAAELDIAFHQEIYRLSNNVVLIQAMACVAYLLKHSIDINRDEILSNASDRVLVQQHQAIYEAITIHDKELAMRLMSEHLNIKKNKER